MKITCEICTKMRSKLKLATVWASSGTPNIHALSIVRHNESVDHTLFVKEAFKIIKKQTIFVVIVLLWVK